jgi:hypothetical protein
LASGGLNNDGLETEEQEKKQIEKLSLRNTMKERTTFDVGRYLNLPIQELLFYQAEVANARDTSED